MLVECIFEGIVEQIGFFWASIIVVLQTSVIGDRV